MGLLPDPDVRGDLGNRVRALEGMEADLRGIAVGEVPVWNGSGWDGGSLPSDRAVGAFAAYRNAAVSYTSGSAVVYDTEVFDLDNWYNPANGRYTPQVAGYYQFAAGALLNAAQIADQGFVVLRLAKTATDVYEIARQMASGTATGAGCAGSSPPVFANGTTDYFTISLLHNKATAASLTVGSSVFNWFGGRFVGTA